MITISELSKKANVTPRTLRYYDSINLLKPLGVTEGGHRTYRKEDIIKLQQIQFLKKVGFSLKEIKQLIENDDLDPVDHIKNQLNLIRSEQKLLKEMERDLVGLLHSHSIEGRLNWDLILQMLQHQQTGQMEMREYSKQWFGEKVDEVTKKLPNINDDNKETGEWIDLIKALQDMMDQPPNSIEVQTIVEEIWMKSKSLYGDDEQLQQQLWEVRKSPEKSSRLGWYPLDEKLLRFLDQAFAIYENGGKIHD
ncbi:MerR family transcriptional regulator [Siminovitchia terrae]|uniref:MerR family transcriptional regulator n=1 Tax=Siminovitchia terrae TaxID=1914933 RepID=UPI001B1CE5AD|nr:MerR family transcriptional regulator [Siminovitchia terrae]GIN90932.1 MerR family transcriptional regulator [Siminovitchia terrae]